MDTFSDEIFTSFLKQFHSEASFFGLSVFQVNRESELPNASAEISHGHTDLPSEIWKSYVLGIGFLFSGVKTISQVNDTFAPQEHVHIKNTFSGLCLIRIHCRFP